MENINKYSNSSISSKSKSKISKNKSISNIDAVYEFMIIDHELEKVSFITAEEDYIALQPFLLKWDTLYLR